MLKVDSRKAPEADIEAGSDWNRPGAIAEQRDRQQNVKTGANTRIKTKTRWWETRDARQLFTKSLCEKNLAELVGVLQTRFIGKKNRWVTQALRETNSPKVVPI